MADEYKIVMSVNVQKGENATDKVEEYFYFTAGTFARMVNLTNDFYELITKLQKVK